MADSCFLCEMGAKHVLKGAPAAGEGFGTCNECSVHACPRHGDRTRQYFRCAECIAAAGTSWALTEPVESNAAELIGEAPRLSSLSAKLREQFDPGRMSAAVNWVHNRVGEKESLLPDVEQGSDVKRGEKAAMALGFSHGEVDPEAAAEALQLRAALVEEQVRDLARGASAGGEELGEKQRARAGETAAVSLAIAYTARGAEDADTSPFELSGGLMLPPPVVVLGHAYSVANHFFW
jgi:hypothetical protein